MEQAQERCPLCGSFAVFRQLLGYGRDCTDPNKRRCDDCGCEWRLVRAPGKRPSDVGYDAELLAKIRSHPSLSALYSCVCTAQEWGDPSLSEVGNLMEELLGRRAPR